MGRVQGDAAANTLAIIERTLQHQTTDQMQQVVDLLLGALGLFDRRTGQLCLGLLPTICGAHGAAINAIDPTPSKQRD